MTISSGTVMVVEVGWWRSLTVWPIVAARRGSANCYFQSVKTCSSLLHSTRSNISYLL